MEPRKKNPGSMGRPPATRVPETRVYEGGGPRRRGKRIELEKRARREERRIFEEEERKRLSPKMQLRLKRAYDRGDTYIGIDDDGNYYVD